MQPVFLQVLAGDAWRDQGRDHCGFERGVTPQEQKRVLRPIRKLFETKRNTMLQLTFTHLGNAY